MSLLKWVLVHAVFVMSFVACQTTPEYPRPGAPVSPEDLHRPRTSVVESPRQEGGSTAPVSVAKKGIRVGVLLGAGGVKTFSYLGVLRELEKAQIPIDMVVGLEWGSLVGAAFANQGRVNDAEWKLLKIKKEDLPKEAVEGLFVKEPGSLGVMSAFLNSVFEARQLGDFRIRFACPGNQLRQDRLVWKSEGAARNAVESCLPYPPIFAPFNGSQAAPFDLEEAVAHLRKSGIDIVVFINAIGLGVGPRSDLLWRELRRTLQYRRGLFDVVVDVPTKGYDLVDLDSARSLIVIGQKSGIQAAKQIEEKLQERK